MRTIFICFIVFCVYFINLHTPAIADPFMSYPGTRAKAMGGAFCGIADDSSAVWYNPAGLVEGEVFDLVFEWSEAIGQDTLKKGSVVDTSQYGVNPETLTNDESKIFFAMKSSNDTNRDLKGSLACYYMSPYTIDWYFPPILQINTTFGNFRERMDIYGIAYANSANSERIKYGLTFEYINIGFKVDGLRYIYEYDAPYYYYNNIVTDYDHAYGFSGSFGLLGILYANERHAMTLKMGGVYRFGSSCSSDSGSEEHMSSTKLAYLELSETIIDQLVFSKPSSYEFGISLSKGVTTLNSTFLFAAQIGVTDWSVANETIDNKYNKISLGSEWQMFFQKTGLRLALRAGLYNSVASKSEKGWPDVEGLTFGFGTLIGKNWGVDCTYENRDIQFERGGSKSLSLLSFAITFTAF